FSIGGLPHLELATQIAAQAHTAGEPFAVVFAGMGITHADAAAVRDTLEARAAQSELVLVLNTADDPETIALGNDRVLRARLADARFFVDEDRKTPLSERVDSLDAVVFQAKLGSIGAKVRRLAEAGVDVIKDDHGLTDQGMAPFGARVRAVQAAVDEANARTGGHTVYFPNVTASADALYGRTDAAREAGCAGVVLCPGLTGMDAMRALAERDTGLALMAHPSHANTSPNADRGIAPDLLMGTLWRLAGADAVIYVNAQGRFAWPVEACLAVNRRARAPLGPHLPVFPVPAGGIQADDVAHWFRLYGPDTLLLVGGSLLEAPDVEAAARRVVQAAREAVGLVGEVAGGAGEAAAGGRVE
ncbi:MAG: glycine--tRNA ligase subunit beta, partial [Longimicrobiales bacterium]|nr:glycine--tRNA ligase subunit beta [Longimicrobiales bacterium]